MNNFVAVSCCDVVDDGLIVLYTAPPHGRGNLDSVGCAASHSAPLLAPYKIKWSRRRPKSQSVFLFYPCHRYLSQFPFYGGHVAEGNGDIIIAVESTFFSSHIPFIILNGNPSLDSPPINLSFDPTPINLSEC